MSTERPYEVIEVDGGVPVKAWIRGVSLEEAAAQQLRNVARLPCVHGWVAVMPDVHWGVGATVGSVIPTVGAIIPAAVGVDIGCGMAAVETTLTAGDLPESLRAVRAAIERAVPHGRIKSSNHVTHLGTLGTGNHFIEVCLDEADRVWIMLHSGSRGVGNKIGTYFIDLAKQDMRQHLANLPDEDLAYLEEGAAHFDDYVEAVGWAQDFAMTNRRLMMQAVLRAMQGVSGLRPFEAEATAVNCHHNYVTRERHGGRDVYLTRKGAVRAGAGDLGIIPGSMGARSYIVRGRGNAESYESCSHGAGRAMSRNEAKRRFTLADHAAATAGVECRKDADVIDETPGAYKPIDAVMAAQRDLVEIVHTLRQVVCVKG